MSDATYNELLLFIGTFGGWIIGMITGYMIFRKPKS